MWSLLLLLLLLLVYTSGAASVANAGIAADGAAVQLVMALVVAAKANLWSRRWRRQPNSL